MAFTGFFPLHAANRRSTQSPCYLRNKALASLSQAQEREILGTAGIMPSPHSHLFPCRSLVFTTWTLSLAQMVTLMKYISTKSSWRPISMPSYVIALLPLVLSNPSVCLACVDSFRSASLGRALPVLHIPNVVWLEIYPLCRCAPP